MIRKFKPKNQQSNNKFTHSDPNQRNDKKQTILTDLPQAPSVYLLRHK